MSYTPDDQKLSDRLDKATDSLEEVANAMRARIKDADSWRVNHLDELAGLISEITSLEIKLRRLSSEVS